MKTCAIMTTYNDYEFLEQALESFKGAVDKLFIIEGCWQTARGFDDGNLRSGKEAYNIIDRYVDSKRIFLVHANEKNEAEQRQVGIDLAKQEGMDWLWIVDSDEVYKKSSIQMINNILSRTLSDESVYEYRLKSYNFINGFNNWYNGDYRRIFKITKGCKIYLDNDMYWPDKNLGTNGSHVKSIPDMIKFYHYNYVKQNSDVFRRKMFYMCANANFAKNEVQNYNIDMDTKKYTIPKDCTQYVFNGKHPRIMKDHPYIVKNIYGEHNILFDRE